MVKPDMLSLENADSYSWGCAYYWLGSQALVAVKRRLDTHFPADVDDIVVTAIKQAADAVTTGKCKLSSFEELIAFTSVIADRRAKDHIRRMEANRRAASATETIEGRTDLVSATPSPLELADAQEVARLLMELAATHLRETPLQLLKDHYLHGRTQEELAEKHNIPLGTVGVTLSRALKTLRKEIEKHPGLMKELKEALR